MDFSKCKSIFPLISLLWWKFFKMKKRDNLKWFSREGQIKFLNLVNGKSVYNRPLLITKEKFLKLTKKECMSIFLQLRKIESFAKKMDIEWRVFFILEIIVTFALPIWSVNYLFILCQLFVYIFSGTPGEKPKLPDGIPPRFPKKPNIKQEGDDLILECILEANPLPEITWYVYISFFPWNQFREKYFFVKLIYNSMFVYIFFVFFHNRYRKDKVIKEDSRITWECKKGKKNRFLLTLRYVVPEIEFKIALEGNGLKKLYFISSYCLKIQFWELDPSLNHSGLKWKKYYNQMGLWVLGY